VIPVPGEEGYAGLRVGLEVHQQLSCPAKLFCACPPVKSEELPYSFERRLRPAQSELGRIDPAAVFEFSKGKSNVYLWNPESSCLVEADEEPPHPLNPDALEAAFLISAALGSNIVDEIHVMRKIVIDGSNTAGFQRTAVVGVGGAIRVDGRTVGVQSVTLEEDAARIIGEDASSRHFALDRLGVPLVEIALDPVTGTPEFVGQVALHLGRTLRASGRVARGLGTTRQDLNVSVMGGNVVEVKGVQKLNLLPRVVEYEVKRQVGLSKVTERLRQRGVKKVKCVVKDVSGVLPAPSSHVLREQLESNGVIVCIGASGLGGLLGWEPSPGVRLGREVAEVARANSVGGVIHSDEFRSQGVTEEEESILRGEMGSGPEDALVLVAGWREDVGRAVPRLVARLQAASRGAPAETRAATDDGETRYMRPRPGSQRMYPETDIPNISVDSKRLRELSRSLPEDWETRVARLTREHRLSRELALQVYDSDLADVLEGLSRSLRLEPSVIASMLVETPVRLAREGVPERALSLPILTELLREIDSGRVAKEAGPEILRAMGAKEGQTVLEAINSLGLEAVGESEIQRVVDAIISRERNLIKERGERAFSPLMGEAMKQLRGRADGATVGRILRERLLAALLHGAD